MRRIWSVVLPLALLACAESPTGLRDELVLEVQQSQAGEESAVVQGAQGGVVVSGVFTTPGSGWTLRAYYALGTDGEVTLWVSSYPPAGPSLGVITGLAYRAAIPLPPGAHDVAVVHFDQRTDGPARNIASGRVTVARQ